jgi:hypothetical protein
MIYEEDANFRVKHDLENFNISELNLKKETLKELKIT